MLLCLFITFLAFRVSEKRHKANRRAHGINAMRHRLLSSGLSGVARTTPTVGSGI
jgi:hypothetical protein